MKRLCVTADARGGGVGAALVDPLRLPLLMRRETDDRQVAALARHDWLEYYSSAVAGIYMEKRL